MRTKQPQVFATFKHIGQWQRERLTQKDPDCFNQVVSVKRYLITVAEIEEPIGVIQQRIRHLWEHSDNANDMGPLREAAAEVGLDLGTSTGWGSKRRE